MPDDSTLTADQFAEQGLSDWTWRDDAIHAHLETGDFATGLRLVNRIGEAAEEMNHHPDLDLRYPHLDVTLSSHDVGGVTERDVRLARAISEYAADEGVGSD
jgi:4a-hydroxytetrahydrobiopterin dehydratase